MSAMLEAGPRADSDSLRRAVQAELPEYRILESIQQGGQGAIYLAHQVGTERKVAIKVLPPTLGPSDGHPVVREAKALGRIDHPNVVTIHASGEVNGYAYLVMQYIDGDPIDEAVPVIRAGVRELAEMFAKVCRGVAAAHRQNIMHCDIKPGNVLIDDDGEPHVLDFGLARLASPASPSSSHTPGTLPWMSPEQLRYRNYVLDHRTDLYSLGVLFYWVLSGEMPYGVDRPREVTPEMIWGAEPEPLHFVPGDDDAGDPQPCVRVDRDLEMIVFKALEKDPADRYASAEAMADDLDRYVQGEAVSVEGMGWRYRLAKKIKRHRVAIAITTALIAAVMATGVAWSNAEALKVSNTATQIATLNLEAERHRSEGDLESALDTYHQSIAIAAEVDGDDSRLRRFEFGALYGLAEMNYIARQPDLAEPYCRQAVALASRMVACYPDDPGWARMEGYARMLEGRSAYAGADWSEAAAAFREAARLRQSTVELHTRSSRSRFRLALAFEGLGRAECRCHRFRESWQAFASARELLEENLAGEPDVDEHSLRLAKLDNYIAWWHLAQPGRDHALAAQELLQNATERLDGITTSGLEMRVTTLRANIAVNSGLSNKRLERDRD